MNGWNAWNKKKSSEANLHFWFPAEHLARGGTWRRGGGWRSRSICCGIHFRLKKTQKIPTWSLTAKAPEKFPDPKKKGNLPFPSFFRGKLLNFGGVVGFAIVGWKYWVGKLVRWFGWFGWFGGIFNFCSEIFESSKHSQHPHGEKILPRWDDKKAATCEARVVQAAISHTMSLTCGGSTWYQQNQDPYFGSTPPPLDCQWQKVFPSGFPI